MISSLLGQNPMGSGLLVLKNNMAVAGWVFMSVWMWGLVMMTYAYFRDGGFHQFDRLLEVGVMGLFWVFGTAGCAHIFSLPRTRVTVDNGVVRATRKWLV